MNNGQFDINSVSTATQLMPQNTAEPVAPTPVGVQQSNGVFAGLLNVIQLQVKGKDLPGSERTEQYQVMNDMDPPALDAVADDPALDLLALLQISPQMISAPSPTVPKRENPESSGVRADIVAQGIDPSNITSQIVLAAYSQPGRMPEVKLLTLIPVDEFQDVTTAAETSAKTPAPPTSPQLPIFSVPSGKIQGERTAVEPLQTAVTLSEAAATLPAPEEGIVLQKISVPASQPGVPSEKSAVESITLSSEPASVRPAAAVTASSPETGLVSEPFQPELVTARVATAPAPADNRSVILSQETGGARLKVNHEPQSDQVRKGNEQSDVKEMASSLQDAASTDEALMDSDTSQGGDSSSREQSGGAADNQALAQYQRGQLINEHQKASATVTKSVLPEPVRPDISEQVMQQVKDRLVQHDLKPGNQHITLTLSPDSFGELKMNLNLQGQKLSVEIVTENRTVRDTIVQHGDALRESLARQNITVESFDVTTGGKGSGSQGQNQNAWQELAKQQQHLWTSPRGDNTTKADLPFDQAAYQRQQGQSMLDIHY